MANDDACRLAATKTYCERIDFFTENAERIANHDPSAVFPEQLWLLAVDPLPILGKALRAERFDPTPPAR